MDHLQAGGEVRSPIGYGTLLRAALLSVLLGAALWSGLAGGRSSPLRSADSTLASRDGLARAQLPVGAREQISAALGAETAAYHASASGGAFQMHNPAQHLSASLGSAGVQLSSGTVRVGLRLRAIGYANSLQRAGGVSPSARGNRVGYARASLGEWYVNGPAGIEQGFTIPRAPSRNASGPLTLSMSVSGNAPASLVAHGRAVGFVHPGARALRYGQLSATDAGGRPLHSWMTVRGASVLLRVDTAGASYPISIDPLIQHGEKLTGTGEEGEGRFGISVALSADGNTALIGSPYDDKRRGSVWVFTRSSSGWIQQGAKLTGGEEPIETSEAGEEACIEEAGEEPTECTLGRGVALSADGNTALIGDPSASTRPGSAWVFTRSGSTWTEQETLRGPNASGEGRFGKGVALSADGNTALIGDPSAETEHGAAWLYTRTGSKWTAHGQSLTAGARSQRIHFGRSVALSSDGNTALIGDPGDVGYVGSAWLLTRSGASWSQLGEALRGGLESGKGRFGYSLALSGDGLTALIGGPTDEGGRGAAWVFTSGGSSFTQQGEKLTPALADAGAHFGYSLALSEDGNTALIGAPREAAGHGAARIFSRTGAAWSEQEEQLAGDEAVGPGWSGASVALSADAKVALVGAPRDDRRAGAAWGFVDEPPHVAPTVTGVTPSSGPAAGGTHVTITGTHFTGANAVSFGSRAAASFAVKSAVSIEAVAPAAPEGMVDVTVANPAGASAISAEDHFRFLTAAKEPGELVPNPLAAGSEEPAGSVGGSGVQGFTGASGCVLSLSGKRIAVRRYRVALFRLLRSGAAPCKGTLTLRYKVKGRGRHFTLKTVGVAGISISSGASQVVKLTLNKAGRAVLRARRGKLNASLSILSTTPTSTLGRTATVRLTAQKAKPAKGRK
jgi:hypothetical protein